MFRLRRWVMRINHVPTFHPRFSLTILTTGSTWRVVLSSLMIAITFQENIRLSCDFELPSSSYYCPWLSNFMYLTCLTCCRISSNTNLPNWAPLKLVAVDHRLSMLLIFLSFLLFIVYKWLMPYFFNDISVIVFVLNVFRCGYPAVNASFYDLSFHPISSNKDCKLYKNSKDIKCYNCDSCKYVSLNFVRSPLHIRNPYRSFHFFVWYQQSRAGVAQYMKIEWRVVAIFNCILFVVLVYHIYTKIFQVI